MLGIGRCCLYATPDARSPETGLMGPIGRRPGLRSLSLNHDKDRHLVLKTAKFCRQAVAAAFVLALAATAASAQTTAPQTPAPSGAQPAPDAVVARVDGQPIFEADIALADEEIGAQLQNYPPAVRRKVLIEFLIENQLFAKAAGAGKVADSTAFKQRMAYWNRRMLRDTYFEEMIQKGITDAEVKKFYDEKVASAASGEEIKASHILVATEDKAKEILELLGRGSEFAELAKQYSTDPGSKDSGGSLGYFTKGRMVPAFEAAAFQLKVGEVSLPVKSQFGWHIIRVDDRRQRKPPPFEAVKERIIAALVRNKARQLGTELRKKAKIEYTGEPPKLNLTPAPAAPGKQ